MRRRLGERDRGALSIELVGIAPLLVLVTLLIVQGMLAVSTVSSVQQAARDGARALSMEGGPSVYDAVHDQIPDWITYVDIPDVGCDPDVACVTVEARIPIGLPAFTLDNVTVSRTAEFPKE